MASPYSGCRYLIRLHMCRIGGNGTENGKMEDFFCHSTHGVEALAKAPAQCWMRHSAAYFMKPPLAGSESVDARGEMGELAGDRVLVENALSDRSVQLRLSQLKRRSRRLLVAGSN